MHRASLAVLAASVLASQALAQPGLPQSWTVIDLGGLPGAFGTYAEGLNNRSEVVGYTQGPLAQVRAFRWAPVSGMIELPPVPGYTDNRAVDISENGIICGVAQNGLTGVPRSWRLVGGVYELLPEFVNGCQHLLATAVNDDGTVVGRLQSTQAGCAPIEGAFYFGDATGLLLLPVLDAWDINNAGVATGQAFAGAYRFHPSTGVEILGTLPGDDGAQGRAINDQGDVVGISTFGVPGPDPWKAFIHGDGQGFTEVSPTLHSRRHAEAVNNLDHVVGSDGTSSSPDKYPWIWSAATGRVALDTRVQLPPDYYTLSQPVGINDRDRIIAKAQWIVGPTSYSAALLLVPQPSFVPRSTTTVFIGRP